jgi:hypothetical protein
MPSPFPGMDPYVESPDWFADLQGSLIVVMKGMLQRILPASYYAESRRREWLEYRRHEFETIEDGPFHESFLEVRRRRGKEVLVVTAVEVLSAYDKMIGNPVREQFLERQREILGGQTHLVEIDLLRGGAKTAAVPEDLVRAQSGQFDYLVAIHRFDRPEEFLIYPIAMTQRLPVIDIPLLPGDPDMPLDLQAAFNWAYDAGPFQRAIEYGKDPIVPQLEPEQATWAMALLEMRRRHR